MIEPERFESEKISTDLKDRSAGKWPRKRGHVTTVGFLLVFLAIGAQQGAWAWYLPTQGSMGNHALAIQRAGDDVFDEAQQESGSGKRAGFVGMRGKKTLADDLPDLGYLRASYPDKKAGFVGMRGKKTSGPSDLDMMDMLKNYDQRYGARPWVLGGGDVKRAGFVGMRGKRSFYREAPKSDDDAVEAFFDDRLKSSAPEVEDGMNEDESGQEAPIDHYLKKHPYFYLFAPHSQASPWASSTKTRRGSQGFFGMRG